MTLYLFGGAEPALGQVPILKALIKQTILEIAPKNILHIPYARTKTTDPDWKPGWFRELLADTGIQIYDADSLDSNPLDKASLVFINGGSDKSALMAALKENTALRQLVMNAENIIAESAGALVMGEYLRATRENSQLIKGLGIVKDTIFEGHYSELQRRDLLLSEMQTQQLKYGVGIDCATGIVFNPEGFPQKWKKLGQGQVEIFIA